MLVDISPQLDQRSFEIFAGLGLPTCSPTTASRPQASLSASRPSRSTCARLQRAPFARPYISDDAVSAPYDVCAAEVRAQPRIILGAWVLQVTNISKTQPRRRRRGKNAPTTRTNRGSS